MSWLPAAGGINPRYDVYFGTNSPGTLVSSNQTATTYDTGTMANSKTYYWKIVSKNDCNSTGVTSSIFDFTTVAACTQPAVVTTPTPSNGAPNIAIDTDLSWLPAAGGAGAKYDVYFGTNSPGTLVSSNQTATTYDTGTMANSKTYYWKIISKNDCNLTGVTSSIFDFTTVAAPCTQPVQATTPTPASPTAGVSMFPTKPTLSWTPAAGGAGAKYDVYFGTATTPVTVISTNQTTTSCNLETLTPTVSVLQGKTYYWKVVSKNDCNPTGVSSAVWNFNTDCVKSTAAFYTVWVGGGSMPWSKPSCWCYQRNCRGDINGTMQFSYWVYTLDLTALKDAYGLQDSLMTGSRICADLNRSAQFSYRVYTLDLGILKTYYAMQESLTPVCAMTDYWFWTN